METFLLNFKQLISIKIKAAVKVTINKNADIPRNPEFGTKRGKWMDGGMGGWLDGCTYFQEYLHCLCGAPLLL